MLWIVGLVDVLFVLMPNDRLIVCVINWKCIVNFHNDPIIVAIIFLNLLFYDLSMITWILRYFIFMQEHLCYSS